MKHKLLFSFLVIAMLAVFIAPPSANAQQRNMTIVTNHPDFSVKVTRCVASGKTVVIDMILENLGTDDVELKFGDSETYFTSGRAWDDQGNEHYLYYKYANDDGYKFYTWGALIAGIKTRLSIRLENIPTDSETIAKLQMDIRCDQWGLGKDKPVIIRFIPITRQ